MEKQIFTNPVTGKRQSVTVKTEAATLFQLGFDETGKVVYQFAEVKGVLTSAGFLPDAKHFVDFKQYEI